MIGSRGPPVKGFVDVSGLTAQGVDGLPQAGTLRPAAMYQSFYGLKEMPFNITPDPRFLYLSPTHQDALRHLEYGVEERKGFMVVIGEVGCGKTTVCRRFLNGLDPERFETALILNPRLNENQMLRAILHELGEPEAGDDSHDLSLRVHQALLRRIDAGKDIVVIIDEAQNLSFDVLEQVRLLSNLETDSQKLLQIILFGQPELKAILKQPELRQLRQRILVHCELKPLSGAETDHYIQHRLATAGANGRPRFTRAAIWWIRRLSRGIPRITNHLCDKALLAAYVRDSDDVVWTDVVRAFREIRQLTH